MGRDMDVREWLREQGADTIGHPGGTLYAHLCRVHDRLAALGCDVDCQLSGLTHAAYGTDGFPRTLLDPTRRVTLRDLVGDAAEALVYQYGACDRRRTWDRLAATGTVHDRFTGQQTTLLADRLTAFVDLSIVNELDVLAHDPGAADRFSGYLRRLFATWAPIASPAVNDEVARVLAAQM